MSSSYGPSSGAAGAGLPADASAEEIQRQRRRRQLARKTPEQRRKMLQYARRHNERDGRLFYCDYCDLFVSSSQRSWRRHRSSAKHMGNVEAYWHMAAHVDSVWLNEINEKIAKAQLQDMYRRQQRVTGRGGATPLPAVQVGHGIVVGGTKPPQQQQLQRPACAAAGVGGGSASAAAPALPTDGSGILSSPAKALPPS